jgi:hypothetical protein
MGLIDYSREPLPFSDLVRCHRIGNAISILNGAGISLRRSEVIGQLILSSRLQQLDDLRSSPLSALRLTVRLQTPKIFSNSGKRIRRSLNECSTGIKHHFSSFNFQVLFSLSHSTPFRSRLRKAAAFSGEAIAAFNSVSR